MAKKSSSSKCPKTGCIVKRGNDYRIVSSKTGKLWPAKYETRAKATAALRAYHAG